MITEDKFVATGGEEDSFMSTTNEIIFFNKLVFDTCTPVIHHETHNGSREKQDNLGGTLIHFFIILFGMIIISSNLV